VKLTDKGVKRRDEILNAAIKLAEKDGYDRLKREDIARAAGCATGLVFRYLGSMNQVPRVIMGEAIRRENVAILAQGLVTRDRRAINAMKKNPELGQRVLTQFSE
jgi:AcrR family transcriptional regulator